MATLFRPLLPIDHTHWIPALETLFKDEDFRIEPETGDPADIHYLITWRLAEGDKERFPNLKAVLSLSAGVNQYTGHPEWPEHAALIRMLDPGLKQSMTEYVTGFVLRFHREHDHFTAAGRNTDWSDVIVPAMATERRVGFMGIGDLGLACINSLRPFGFQLRGWSRNLKNIDGVQCFAGREQLKAFMVETDILVCLLPLTKETEDILNKETMGMLPQRASVINAARGKHIVDDDLISLLDSGHLSMAALDVFRKEPLPDDHPFWDHPKIIVTPHIAAVTMPQTAAQVIKETIELIEKGGKPAGLVDLTRGY